MEEGDDQTLAIISLIAGVAGFVVMPLILSAVAVICGKIQLDRIEEDPATYGGKTLALVGFWIGIIRGILVLFSWIVALVMIFLVFGMAFLTAGM